MNIKRITIITAISLISLYGLFYLLDVRAESCQDVIGIEVCENLSDSIGGNVFLQGVSVVSSSEVWVAGYENNPTAGKVSMYNGSSWFDHSAFVSAGRLYDIHASSSNNVWVGGASGELWKYDGTTWTDFTPGVGVRWGTADINSIFAYPSGVWIAGTYGEVWQYDGSWHERTGILQNLFTITGVSYLENDNKIWVGGELSNVGYVYEGDINPSTGSVAWTQHTGFRNDEDDEDDEVWDISAYSPDAVFIAAYNRENIDSSGYVYMYNGSTWTQHSIPTDNFLEALSAGIENEIWVVGSSDNVLELNIPTWSTTNTIQTVTLNGIEYTWEFYVENVCRNGGDITGLTDSSGTESFDNFAGANACETSGGSHDPSTLKVNVEVSWAGGNSVTRSDYITRWQNKSCLQTEWSNLSISDSARICPTVDYSAATNINTGSELSILEAILESNGTLTSVPFETINQGNYADVGPAYNSVMWKGTLPAGTKVRFQIAAADCPNGKNGSSCSIGAWNYIGLDCIPGSWSDLGNPDTPIKIDCPNELNNKRFFKYKLQLCDNGSGSSCTTIDALSNTSPTVTDIIINWSP